MDWLAAMVEASQLGAFARGSSWAYPVANLIHLLGLVLLVGGSGIVDLWLIGLYFVRGDSFEFVPSPLPASR